MTTPDSKDQDVRVRTNPTYSRPHYFRKDIYQKFTKETVHDSKTRIVLESKNIFFGDLVAGFNCMCEVAEVDSQKPITIQNIANWMTLLGKHSQYHADCMVKRIYKLYGLTPNEKYDINNRASFRVNESMYGFYTMAPRYPGLIADAIEEMYAVEATTSNIRYHVAKIRKLIDTARREYRVTLNSMNEDLGEDQIAAIKDSIDKYSATPEEDYKSIAYVLKNKPNHAKSTNYEEDKARLKGAILKMTGGSGTKSK